MATLKVIICSSLLVFIKTAAAELDFKCTQEVTRHPHYDRCNKFYMCQNEKVFIDTCPGGQLFDAPSRECVDKSKAICAQRPTTTETPTTVSGFRCGVMFGNFPNGEQCDHYYECFNFLPYNRTCPQGTLFDQQMYNCLDYTQVDCGNRVIPDGVTTNLGFKCTKEITVHPHFYDCSKYYLCQNEKAYINSCAKGKSFDAPSASCVESSKAICARIETTQAPPTTAGPFKCTEKQGYFFHEELCERYYECYNWLPYNRACPPGRLFDQKRKQCLEEARADCGNRIRPIGPTTEIVFTDPTETEQVTETETFTETEQFTEKWDTTTTEEPSWTETETEHFKTDFTTPEPITTEQLTTTQKATTTTEKITTKSTTTKRPIITTEDDDSGEFVDLECPKPDGRFPHPKNPHQFIVCIGNYPHLMECPADLVFDPSKEVCVWNRL